jgi:hypothetical protein
VKYIAKSAAKNINSLDNQTIVPTATMLGRFIFCEVRGAAAVVIGGLFPIPGGNEIFSGWGGTHFG